MAKEKTAARKRLVQTARANLDPRQIDRIEAALARKSHLAFMARCWQSPEPFVVGKHTRAICQKIDEGMERYARGESTFLILECPFRHGKSQIVSRALPPHWLGRFPDTEVMLTTYGDDLATDLSRSARAIIESPAYARTYPGIVISEESSAANRWAIRDHEGKVSAAGLGGAIMGRGCSLGIVDDYLKRRQDAESKSTRDKIWQSFTDDFMTRRAPVSFIIILATPWHVDDLIARCKKKMEEDPEFPRFKEVKFPASSDGSFSQESLLFPERFSRSWYLSQRATLGRYGTASLLQCSPTVHEGNLLKTDDIQFYDPFDPKGRGVLPPQGLRWVRAWDLASSKKEVVSENPDWTVGLKMAIQTIYGNPGEPPVEHLWFDDFVRVRLTAPQRDAKMNAVAAMDGPRVRVAVETVAGYKDTGERIKDRLLGRVYVESVNVSRDLVGRCEDVEPIFEAGHVHMRRAAWNAELVQEWGDFPSGEKDDTIAAMMAGYDMLHTASNMSDQHRREMAARRVQ